MRGNNNVCLAVILLMTGLAAANTVWNPTDPNALATGVGRWAVAANWSSGLPDASGVDNDGKAAFAGNPIECLVDEPVTAGQLVIGDNGDSQTNFIRVADGGSITIADSSKWTGIGYNRGATLCVEKGGSCDFAGHLWITTASNSTGSGTLIVDGGTVTNGGSFRIGNDSVTQGQVYIDKGGVLNVDHGESILIEPEALMDIGFGTFIIGGDRTADCAAYVADGRLTAFGGAGTVVYDYGVTRAGKTTVTAEDPMHRAPAYTTVQDGDVDLTWTNLAPESPATSVWVDVWFGTDPNKLSPVYTKVMAEGENETTVKVNAPVIPPAEQTTYYWQVDSYVYGDPSIVDYSDPNFSVIEGAVIEFDVTNNIQPSIAILTPPTVTWINEPIPMETVLTDDNPAEVTYLWTSDDPNAMFLPDNTVANPSVKVDYHAAQFTVTVTVDDGFNPPSSASVTHDCADNPCQAAGVINLGDLYPGDIAGDCVIDLADFAAIAREWLSDYALTEPIPVPQE